MRFTAAICGAGACVALVMGLSGCGARGEGASTGLALSGSKYCTAFRTTSAANTSGGLAAPLATDQAAAFDDCVHRWAYTLAPDHDPADVVARASVDACSSILAAWNQQTLNQTPQASQPEQSQSQPNGVGQPNSALAERMRTVEARSLFYVVQARAAGCAPPPANTLVATPGPYG